jgi:NADH-quinone oxidoreductase subunit H
MTTLTQTLKTGVDSLMGLWQGLPDWVQVALLGVLVFALIAGLAQVAVVFMVLMERKVLAWLTQRKGPNRVGPWGLLQTVADGVKLLFKEDIMSPSQDKFLFTLAPALFFLPVFVLFAFLPITSSIVAVALPAGLLFLFALSSLSVVGVVLAGWASNNKYSLLGGMRSAAQAISYEIPLVLSVLAITVYTGTMDVSKIVAQQDGIVLLNYLFLLPITFAIFFISAIAEINRVPFDLPEAESELVSGYNTEYSGMKFAMFFLAEYAALFVMAGLMTSLFLGGYNCPFGFYMADVVGPTLTKATQLPFLTELIRHTEMATWFIAKTYFFIFIIMWVRGTLPRLKPDQLMGFSWKFLIPLSLINLFLVAAQRFFVSTQNLWMLGLWLVVLVGGVGGFFHFSSGLLNQQILKRITTRSV